MPDSGNGNKYPHREFKVSAHDGKGHTEKVQLRMTPQMFAMVNKAMGTKIWPYENWQELVRHAIKRHLSFLEADEPRCGNLTAELKAIDDTLYDEEMNQEFQSTYDHARVVMNQNRKLGGKGAAARNLGIISNVWRRIRKMDEEYWRNLWMERVRQEYEDALSAAPAIGFVELEDREEEEDGE